MSIVGGAAKSSAAGGFGGVASRLPRSNPRTSGGAFPSSQNCDLCGG